MQRRDAIVIGAAVCSPFAFSQGTSSEVIGLDEARRLHESASAVLIDIREPQEHATGVAAGALLLPMSQLGKRVQEIPLQPDKPVLLICNTQNRSAATLRALRQQLGEQRYAHVRYVHGGMSEWAKRGWPMVKPSSPFKP
ncbi:rhodanese-like domain-containing protein [Variovorax sp. PCZ-1]|uniref:rhodanese-like domain-containing protein n=1 Tax=Variovorax sp. PCZ-1 TaxID=2835533 RepID=UPI001BCBE2CA|nr:rhodanese-like domain-containing protein [Variovorax sp. PCZ-1]MBS7806648.1 rhodanese-like domain-containing protein [Variovorax sp. PCZ-1]